MADYLTFSSQTPFTLNVNSNQKYWNGVMYYSNDSTVWSEWDGTTIISSAEHSGEHRIYMRGVGNSVVGFGGQPTNSECNKARWVLTGENIRCVGNIEMLLDYETVAMGEHPAMGEGCFAGMFFNCKTLTQAPELPATTLAKYCYYKMLYGCASLKLSETQTDEYQTAYRIPTVGEGTTAYYALENMLTNTGGTFSGTPEINTTYYGAWTVQEEEPEPDTEPIGFIEYLVNPKYRMGNPFRGFFGWQWARKGQNGEAEEPAKVYGVEWDYSQSSTKLTRTNDADAFADPVPATDLTSIGTSPFDNVLPWSGMKRETIGTDEMVYIPEFYFRVEDDQNNQKIRWKITSKPKDGFALHPGSGRYISRYHTSAGYASVSGAMPIGGLTRATFRTNSHAKGANWWMNDVATWSALQILYLVEFADWNCQTALGRGQTSGSIIATGGTDAAAYHTVKRDGASHQYRWIENPYSNIRDWLDGSVNVSNRVYVGTDNAVFGDTTAGYTDTGLTIPASSSAYPTRLGISEAAPWMFIPVQGGGSGNTYIPDLSIGGSSTTLRVTGGKCTYSAEWGLFKYDSNDPAGFTAADVGARLIYIPQGKKMLLSSDGHTLTDVNGVYLIPKEDE